MMSEHEHFLYALLIRQGTADKKAITEDYTLDIKILIPKIHSTALLLY